MCDNATAMRPFLIGLIVGLVALAGYIGYQRHREGAAPCADRCGEGTLCERGICRCARARPARKARPRKRRGPGRRNARAVKSSGDGQLKRAGRAERVSRSQGPPLGGADRLDFTGVQAKGEARELSEAEVEGRYRKLEDRVLGCVERAREGW